MRKVTVEIKGLTAYSPSRFVHAELKQGETRDEMEQRMWREKAHADERGIVFIPGASFKLALDEAAKLANEKIRGRGQQTYGKVVTTGVTALGDMSLGVKVDDLQAIQIFANADGVRGSGSRVTRIFPILYKWGGQLTLGVFNDTLEAAVVEKYLMLAGALIGVGRGRPATGCAAGNGRFEPVKFTWQ